jgi:S1-C subfamily serine protease
MEKEKKVEEKKSVVNEVTVTSKPTIEEKKAVPVVTTVPIPPSPTPMPIAKKKRRGGLLLFWFLVLLVIGGSFTLFGIFLANSVIPSVRVWLMDHSFIEKQETDTDKREQNSPFLPQPTDSTDGAKGSVGYTIPQIVKKVSPGVVSIAVASTELGRDGIAQSSDNIGTGFVIDASGIIVTNQHVVSNANGVYQVVTSENKTYKAKKIIRDEVNDIAIIIVEAKDLATVDLGNSDQIQVGETVIAIGTPLGEYPGSVTVGVISGLGRSVKTSGGFWEVAKEYENVIQTDAAVNPGNSGGPLLNLSGEVIGVNFATTGGADNISFALPANLIKQKVAEYKQYGKFRSAYLGVSYRMVTQQESLYYNVEVGALVQSVASGSPAESAKLQIGDIITKINDTAITTSLASVLAKHKVGEEITVSVYRTVKNAKPEQITLKVVLVDRPADL